MRTRAPGGLLLAALFAVSVSGGPVRSDPAVSSINGKVSTFGGAVSKSDNDAGAAGVIGSLTLPLLYSVGLQIDGSYAQLGGDNFGSGGAHLFWRDPKVGMLGIYGGYAYLDREGGQSIGRVGAEAQYFIGNLTLDGAVGRMFDDAVDTAYGRARVQYYPLDNLMLQAGFITDGDSSGTAGFEYQLTSTADYGVSIYSDGRINDGDHYSVLGGLRLFLGDSMSLKDRHRRQDPTDYVQDDLEAALNAAIAARQARQNQSSPPADDDIAACSLAEDPTEVGSALVNGNYPDGPPTCACPFGTSLAGRSPVRVNKSYYCTPERVLPQPPRN